GRVVRLAAMASLSGAPREQGPFPTSLFEVSPPLGARTPLSGRRAAVLQEGARVQEAPVLAHLEVEVRAGRVARGPLVGEKVAALDQVPVLDRDVVQVSVERRPAVAVGDDHVIAVAGGPMEDPRHARVGREDLALVGAGDVVTGVEMAARAAAAGRGLAHRGAPERLAADSVPLPPAEAPAATAGE